MSEKPLDLHQSFVTRFEMMAAITSHARMIALAGDHHLSTGLTMLNMDDLRIAVDRMKELTSQLIAATSAESFMNTTQLGAQVQIDCELTVTPSGSI